MVRAAARFDLKGNGIVLADVATAPGRSGQKTPVRRTVVNAEALLRSNRKTQELRGCGSADMWVGTVANCGQGNESRLTR